MKHDEKQLKRVLRDELMVDEPVEGVTVDKGDVVGVRRCNVSIHVYTSIHTCRNNLF
jgi:hypothetical protein